MPDYTLIETTFSDKIDAMLPLLQMHRDELASMKHLMELVPYKAAYRALEDSGALLALIAYRDGEIVGYSINFIGPHLHYSGLRYAHNDALFVRPDLRGSRLGIRLMRETERRAAQKGARLMMWHAKPDSALERILPRMGYVVEETAFCKEL